MGAWMKYFGEIFLEKNDKRTPPIRVVGGNVGGGLGTPASLIYHPGYPPW